MANPWNESELTYSDTQLTPQEESKKLLTTLQAEHAGPPQQFNNDSLAAYGGAGVGSSSGGPNINLNRYTSSDVTGTMPQAPVPKLGEYNLPATVTKEDLGFRASNPTLNTATAAQERLDAAIADKNREYTPAALAAMHGAVTSATGIATADMNNTREMANAATLANQSANTSAYQQAQTAVHGYDTLAREQHYKDTKNYQMESLAVKENPLTNPYGAMLAKEQIATERGAAKEQIDTLQQQLKGIVVGTKRTFNPGKVTPGAEGGIFGYKLGDVEPKYTTKGAKGENIEVPASEYQRLQQGISKAEDSYRNAGSDIISQYLKPTPNTPRAALQTKQTTTQRGKAADPGSYAAGSWQSKALAAGHSIEDVLLETERRRKVAAGGR